MSKHVFRLVGKLLFYGKITILKALFYFAYIFFSIRSGIACFRMLVKQLRHKFGLTFQTILSVLYLAYISAQLFEFSANQVRFIYKKTRHQMRMICYEFTIEEY